MTQPADHKEKPCRVAYDVTNKGSREAMPGSRGGGAVAGGSWLVESRGQGASQTEKLSARRCAEGPPDATMNTCWLPARECAGSLMEHVLNGSEARKTARDGTQTHEEKQPGLGPQDP